MTGSHDFIAIFSLSSVSHPSGYQSLRPQLHLVSTSGTNSDTYIKIPDESSTYKGGLSAIESFPRPL